MVESLRRSIPERPSTGLGAARLPRNFSLESLTERVRDVTVRKSDVADSKARTESLKMQLKQHKQMVDAIK